MRLPRACGILLHPTSLPGPAGIGDLGEAAFRFADFLAQAGQRIWQVLPLGPTGYGDSPYQCFSAFAGNPLLIALDRPLAGEFPEDRVPFGELIPLKTAALRAQFEGFRGGAEFEEFCHAERLWLEDYALFMALKRQAGGAVWTDWPAAVAQREPAALARRRQELAAEIAFQQYLQFLFFSQWRALRAYCHDLGIRLMGDLPIYVAHDSSDVWANPDLFHLRPDGRAAVVAGVPPDYFSSTGQLWGNPIYRWDLLAGQNYGWWIERFRAIFDLVDLVRLDHFRGFEAYWEVPGGDPTAEHGRWVPGPGAGLFRAVKERLGDLPIVAENLGVITPAVEAIRIEFGFPGMAVLQFAFGSDPQGPSFRPHNFPRELVAYSGTHDNDTTMGWWTSQGAGDSTRTPEDILRERRTALDYLATGGSEMNWTFIRALYASVADTVLIPLQDVLGLGSEARMNVPARPSGNWTWRAAPGALTQQHANRLRTLTELYDR